MSYCEEGEVGGEEEKQIEKDNNNNNKNLFYSPFCFVLFAV